ncbi:hypothetical protein T4D_10042 [Trichinella pseudospiralis]|uniref:Uncharacterized protein n=1 Tax=Trichinella pseudospiralis TaxID=6337 RepID=A0A0V1FPX0_TRIPS|nr:hypothetical protein T4D_10042 [Trichinella pseudospiralis]
MKENEHRYLPRTVTLHLEVPGQNVPFTTTDTSPLMERHQWAQLS